MTRLLALVLFGASPAWAIGLCEGDGAHLEPSGVSLAAHAVVFDGYVDFCEETDGGEERRQKLPVKVVLGFGGGVRGRFLLIERATPTVKQIAHAESLLGGPVKIEAAWKKEEAALGALERPARVSSDAGGSKSPNGACELRLPLGEAGKGKDGFPKAKLSVSVRAGDKELLARGLAWTVPGDVPAFGVFDPAKGALTVAWVTTVCAGGPPPGAMGEDDPGDCYESDKAAVLTIAGARAKKQLAACFAPKP